MNHATIINDPKLRKAITFDTIFDNVTVGTQVRHDEQCTEVVYTLPVMGTVASLRLRHQNKSFRSVVADSSTVSQCFKTLQSWDERFSPYKSESLVCQSWNGVSVEELSEQDEDFANVLEMSKLAEKDTNGLFTAWLPDGNGGLHFDPTGITKGAAMDAAAERLSIQDFCLAVGGDVICHSSEQPWSIGVVDANNRQSLAYVLELNDGAVMTSGSAERGAHIYSPNEKEFIEKSGSVTVIGNNAAWADVWATALFLNQDSQYVENFKNLTQWEMIVQ